MRRTRMFLIDVRWRRRWRRRRRLVAAAVAVTAVVAAGAAGGRRRRCLWRRWRCCRANRRESLVIARQVTPETKEKKQKVRSPAPFMPLLLASPPTHIIPSGVYQPFLRFQNTESVSRNQHGRFFCITRCTRTRCSTTPRSGGRTSLPTSRRTIGRRSTR